MRIIIDDEFDSDLEEEYKEVDKDLVVGNGVLFNEKVPIIEINDVSVIENNDKVKKISKDELLEDTDIKEEHKVKQNNKSDKFKGKQKEKSIESKKIKGEITVYSKLEDVRGECISDAKINLYALNGLSPKLISSKFTDKDGIVIFDNLEEGSYRVIQIVNRKYFEKPTYVQWNEVTINKELYKEDIIVVNKIKKY